MNSPDDGYVWIMPTHPVYATRSETGDWILSDDSAVAFDAESAIGIDGYWHEVSDIIEWDGTSETLHKILLASEDRWYFDIEPFSKWLSVATKEYVYKEISLGIGWRIQFVGDSFVILPPKDGDA